VSETGVRYRIVTRSRRPGRNTEEHVSSVVLSREEAQASLEVEADLMQRAGWEVERVATAAGTLRVVTASRGARSRTIRARAFTPMEDLP
jgi:hypothetical protein